MSVETKTFHWADYLVFAMMLILSASVGVFYAVKDRRKRSANEFLMAGRQMNLIPVMLSLAASFISAITVLGIPAEIYKSGTMFVWNGMGFFFAILGASQIYIPIFYRLRLSSVYEYLRLRFDGGVRLAGAILFFANMIIYMSVVVYAPSLAFNAVTGISLWGAVVAAIAVCTLYTTLGGMKAVLWTDSLQIGVIIAGLLSILIKGSQVVGGFGKAWDIAESGDRLRFLDYSFDPRTRHSIWSLAIGSAFPWLYIYGVNQAQVQRELACKTLTQTKIAVWLGLVSMWIIIYLCCMTGIIMYAYYAHCDPLTAKRIISRDQLVPLIVMDVLGQYPGVPGLFLACVFSGSISTVSSGLNALVTIVLEDFLKTSCVKNLSVRQEMWLSKGLILGKLQASRHCFSVLGLGIASLGFTWIVSQLGPILSVGYSLFGLIGGPQFGLFTLGILFPWTNKWGAYSGFFSSLVLVFWIYIGKFIHKPINIPDDPPRSCPSMNVTDVGLTSILNSTITPTAAPELDPLYGFYQISYMWYGGIAATTCVVVGLVVSFLTGYTRPSTVDPRLICPLFDVLFPFLPKRLRRFLWFGVRHDEKDEWDLQKQNNVTAAKDNRMKAKSEDGYVNVSELDTGQKNLAYDFSDENRLENREITNRKHTKENSTAVTKL